MRSTDLCTKIYQHFCLHCRASLDIKGEKQYKLWLKLSLVQEIKACKCTPPSGNSQFILRGKYLVQNWMQVSIVVTSSKVNLKVLAGACLFISPCILHFHIFFFTPIDKFQKFLLFIFTGNGNKWCESQWQRSTWQHPSTFGSFTWQLLHTWINSKSWNCKWNLTKKGLPFNSFINQEWVQQKYS